MIFDMSSLPVLDSARAGFHNFLSTEVVFSDADGVPNFADKSSRTSSQIALKLAALLNWSGGAVKPSAQSSGKMFELAVASFLEKTFPLLHNLRPGRWQVLNGGIESHSGLADFEQYEHLAQIAKIAEQHPEIAFWLGNDYLIKPDIVICRWPEEELAFEGIASTHSARLAPLRLLNQEVPVFSPGAPKKHLALLHASISCKFTLRSDRAQNARSEALNLIRNRRGHAPHVVAVTMEPMPSRIASLALGASDLDCVYHVSLFELFQVLEADANEFEEQLVILKDMVSGKRLRDISDLPVDLAV